MDNKNQNNQQNKSEDTVENTQDQGIKGGTSTIEEQGTEDMDYTESSLDYEE